MSGYSMRSTDDNSIEVVRPDNSSFRLIEVTGELSALLARAEKAEAERDELRRKLSESSPPTLLEELIASGQCFDTAFYWLTRVPKSAIRLPHWDPDCAIEMWTSDDGTKRRLRWCEESAEDVDLMSTELLSKEWEIWRLK